jgi:hypothetical protein
MIDLEEALAILHTQSVGATSVVKKELARLRQWVADLQSGLYVNCVYCGHRYGPSPGTPVAMADVLKDHIAQCAEHPLSTMVRRCEYLEGIVKHTKRKAKVDVLTVHEHADSDFSRASGEMPCEACRRPLRRHLQPLPRTCPTVVEDCLGKRWKL